MIIYWYIILNCQKLSCSQRTHKSKNSVWTLTLLPVFAANTHLIDIVYTYIQCLRHLKDPDLAFLILLAYIYGMNLQPYHHRNVD